METGEIIYKQYINLGVAVDTDRGLIVPVLRGVDALSIPQIAQGIQAMADKVRNGQQSLDDLRGGTFTHQQPWRRRWSVFHADHQSSRSRNSASRPLS